MSCTDCTEVSRSLVHVFEGLVSVSVPVPLHLFVLLLPFIIHVRGYFSFLACGCESQLSGVEGQGRRVLAQSSFSLQHDQGVAKTPTPLFQHIPPCQRLQRLRRSPTSFA